MTTICTDPYTVTLRPGRFIEQHAERCARMIVDRWLPGHKGGVHILMTPRLTKAINAVWQSASDNGYTVEIRVTIENNIPTLTLGKTYQENHA